MVVKVEASSNYTDSSENLGKKVVEVVADTVVETVVEAVA